MPATEAKGREIVSYVSCLLRYVAQAKLQLFFQEHLSQVRNNAMNVSLTAQKG